MNKMAEFNKRWGGASEAEAANQARHTEWQRPDPMASWREREGNYAANTEEQNKAIIKAREDYLKKIADEAKKAEDAIKSLHEEVKKLEDEFSASKTFSGESSNYERMQDMLRSDYQLSGMEQKRADTETEIWVKAAERENEILMDKVKEYEKTHKSMIDLTERTAEAMQANFSNLFFDAMTGKLKTLEDYAKAVFESIARMASDVAAQQLTRGLFGPDMKGGGWLSSIAGMFGGGAGNLPINQPGFAGAETFHTGGTVGVSGRPMRSIPAHYFATTLRLFTERLPTRRSIQAARATTGRTRHSARQTLISPWCSARTRAVTPRSGPASSITLRCGRLKSTGPIRVRRAA